ncbi:MAG: oxidoreductase [Planctomycetota bacterium]|jgi:sulfhydrogenase subunit delta
MIASEKPEQKLGDKPRIAVVKFASCDGCQLTLLDCEDELLALADRVHFAHFAEASSDLQPGPYDLTIVEGSISTPEDKHRIVKLRSESKKLITIGACATSGGVQALRNFARHDDFMKAVYASPEMIDSLERSTPIAEHVQVDFELRGCPVDKQQLIEVVLAFAHGRHPKTSTECVCQPCKRRGTVCVVVSQKKPCLGPVTQAGCGAICPAYDRGCYACFGPSSQPNMQGLSDGILEGKLSKSQAAMYLQSFHAASKEFADESRRLWQIQPLAQRESVP